MTCGETSFLEQPSLHDLVAVTGNVVAQIQWVKLLIFYLMGATVVTRQQASKKRTDTDYVQFTTLHYSMHYLQGGESLKQKEQGFVYQWVVKQHQYQIRAHMPGLGECLE